MPILLLLPFTVPAFGPDDLDSFDDVVAISLSLPFDFQRYPKIDNGGVVRTCYGMLCEIKKLKRMSTVLANLEKSTHSHQKRKKGTPRNRTQRNLLKIGNPK
eukprot:990726-Amphidinium_carterae.1